MDNHATSPIFIFVGCRDAGYSFFGIEQCKDHFIKVFFFSFGQIGVIERCLHECG